MQPSLVCKWGTPCAGAMEHSARTARRCFVGCAVLDGSRAYYLMGYLRVLGSTRGHSPALAVKYLLGTPAGTARALQCAAAVAARPRAARVVLSCAGAYLSGAAGSNACPAGSVWIATEAACRTAALAAGKIVPSAFVETDPYAPRGCYYASMSTSVYFNYAYFNPHPFGAGDSTYRLLCAVTSGAPPPPPLPVRTRAYTCACSGTVHVQRRVRELHAHVRDRACVAVVRRCCGVLTAYCTGARASVGHFRAVAVRTCRAA